MQNKVFLIIGEIFVDTHIDIKSCPVRLGGIFHSARAFSAINSNYFIAYYAPRYLINSIEKFSCKLKTKGAYQIGEIDNSPNVMLVRESKEINYQGYENILREQAVYKDTCSVKEIINKVLPTDIIIYPGKYNIKTILSDLEEYRGKIHIDLHYDSENILENCKVKIETCILSTSSELFRKNIGDNKKHLISYFKKFRINNLLVKENRGGSYLVTLKNKKIYEAPAFFVKTKHSVGVGDCFNSILLAEKVSGSNENLKLASLFAAKYAETLCHDKFVANIQSILNHSSTFIHQEGIRLSWEDRPKKDIYIAAPDFPDVNTKLLDDLKDSLEYHNFKPRFPIRENGLVKYEMSDEEKLQIFKKDIVLLNKCGMLIAVLLTNDSGTFVELGMLKEKGIPTILFDPYNICKNNFVIHTPNFICHTVEEVIEHIYICMKRN